MTSVLTITDMEPLDIDSLVDEPPSLPPPDQLHVWVLIDGDQCIFHPEGYLARGEQGGRDAAKMIAEFVHEEFGERTDFVLLVYVFWNLVGLVRTLQNNNYPVTWDNMRGFIQGFQHPAFNYCIDTGKAKESVDSKLHALFRDNLRSCRTKHIFVGFSDDHGYDTEFRKEVVARFSSRIGLIKGNKHSHPQMTLQCPSHEIKGLFLQEKLISQRERAVAGELQRSPSSADPLRQPNVPTTPDRGQALSLPPPSGGSSKGPLYVIPSRRNSSASGSALGIHKRQRSINSPLGLTSSLLSSPLSIAGSLAEDRKVSEPLAPTSAPAQDNSPRNPDSLLLRQQEFSPPFSSYMRDQGQALGDTSRQSCVISADHFRIHSMICPSVDDSNSSFTITSCSDASRCSYVHQCPFGAECAFRKAGVCNFPEVLDDAVE